MTSEIKSENYQSFRIIKNNDLPLSTDNIKIIAHYDESLGYHIVLWGDIMDAFKNVIHVRNGDTIISFVKDKNFEKYVYQHGYILIILFRYHLLNASMKLNLIDTP